MYYPVASGTHTANALPQAMLGGNMLQNHHVPTMQYVTANPPTGTAQPQHCYVLVMPPKPSTMPMNNQMTFVPQQQPMMATSMVPPMIPMITTSGTLQSTPPAYATLYSNGPTVPTQTSLGISDHRGVTTQPSFLHQPVPPATPGAYLPRSIPNETTEPSSFSTAIDPACESTIADLRKEKTDRNVRARVIRLPIPICIGIMQHLASSESLMAELCLRGRGIIVAHIVERLGGDASQPMLAYAVDHFMELSLNQSGCIALPRIMASLHGVHLQTFFELSMQNLPVLIDHPFGNYIVKHFAGLQNASFNKRLLEYFAHHVVSTATNKYGSHVLEDVLRAITVDDLYPFARMVFEDPNGLRTLSFDRYANYCIQTVFRILATGDHQFHSWCVGQAIAAARGSPYEQNIMKCAVAGYRSP